MAAILEDSAPVWVAPMAGGPSRPELVIAAAQTGHMAQLAGGYKTPEKLADEIAAVRAAGVELFGVNLFVPNVHEVDPDAYDAYARALAADAEHVGATLDAPITEDDDAWAAKLALLVEDPVPVVSFTFGLPDEADIAALRRAGSITIQTVTSAYEAARAEAAGVDLLVVQGPDAGGHSGVWAAGQLPGSEPLEALIADVRGATGMPIVAAGGVSSRAGVESALEAGASAVAVGTVVLRSPESGASVAHRAALADPRFTDTALTRAFTGRPARALRNDFLDAHDAGAPVGYPAIHHLTKGLRAAATAQGDLERIHLWAGTGWRDATERPVAEILADLLPR